MSDPRPMPLDTSAYLSDTGHLSTIEHGAYLLILMALWRSRDGSLDGSDQYLARVTRMTIGRWKRVATTIRALLLTKDGRVSQKRVNRDRDRLAPGSESNSDQKRSPGENPNREAKPLKNNRAPPKQAPPGGVGSFSLEGEKDSNPSVDRRKTKGRILPPDWRPRDQERLYGRTVLHLTDGQVDAAAEKMRRWAVSNQHRAVARKSDWDMTFRNWLDSESERRSAHPNAPPPGKSGGGGFAAVFEEMRETNLARQEDHHDDRDDAEPARLIPARRA